MAELKVSLSKDEKSLIIEIPFDKKGSESGSGKSQNHATTSGNKVTDLKVNGKLLTVGVNAYTKKDKD